MAVSKKPSAADILALYENYKARYENAVKANAKPPAATLKMETLFNDSSHIDVDQVCPLCGTHRTGVFERWESATCSCGYGFNEKLPAGEQKAVVDTRAALIAVTPDNEKVVVLSLNKTEFEYDAGYTATATSADIKPVALALIRKDKKYVYVLDNNDVWVEKNIQLCPTFARWVTTLLCIDINGKETTYTNAWRIMDGLYMKPVKKSAVMPVQIPTRDIQLSDVVDVAVAIYNEDMNARRFTGQGWCQNCGEVFDVSIDSDASSSTISCPKCGTSVHMQHHEFIGRNSTRTFVDVSEENNRIYFVVYNVLTDNEWNSTVTASMAVVADRETGKAKLYRSSNGWIEESRKLSLYRRKTTLNIPDDLNDELGVLEFLTAPSYYSFNIQTLCKYLTLVLKCPEVADMVKKYPEFTRDLFTFYDTPQCAPFSLNLRKKTFSEIFGVSKALYEASYRAQGRIPLWQLKELGTMDGITEDDLIFIIENKVQSDKLNSCLYMSGDSVSDAVAYLKTVKNNQGIPGFDAVEFWNRYLSAYDDAQVECLEKHPDNLASDMYRAEMLLKIK